MKTGEGKTLVSTLPVYLNGLTGRGVHLVTVNDYLASFHAEWMGRIYKFLGLTVGLVGPEQWDPDLKRIAYAARRHLRHQHRVRLRLPARQHGPVARPDGAARHHVFAIVDEVDSILIDEARTPLIISGPAAESAQALLPVRRHRARPPPRGRLRGRRGEADRRPHRGGHREGRAPARRRQPLRRARSRTSCTSSRPPCGPRSCTSATRTTSSRRAR